MGPCGSTSAWGSLRVLGERGPFVKCDLTICADSGISNGVHGPLLSIWRTTIVRSVTGQYVFLSTFPLSGTECHPAESVGRRVNGGGYHGRSRSPCYGRSVPDWVRFRLLVCPSDPVSSRKRMVPLLPVSRAPYLPRSEHIHSSAGVVSHSVATQCAASQWCEDGAPFVYGAGHIERRCTRLKM